MTTSIKSVNHHENFVKAVTPTEKQIEKLAAFGIEGDLVTLFVNAVNWIVINDNKRRSMKYFKKNQPLVDAGLANLIEEDGSMFLKLSRKGHEIVEGKTPKINVSQEPRMKVKQFKGYVSTGEINEDIQAFLDKTNYSVRSTQVEKSRSKVKIHKNEGKSNLQLVIYEKEIKFAFFGNKKQEKLDLVLSRLPEEMVIHSKMSNSFGYILLSQESLKELPQDVLDF